MDWDALARQRDEKIRDLTAPIDIRSSSAISSYDFSSMRAKTAAVRSLAATQRKFARRGKIGDD